MKIIDRKALLAALIMACGNGVLAMDADPFGGTPGVGAGGGGTGGAPVSDARKRVRISEEKNDVRAGLEVGGGTPGVGAGGASGAVAPTPAFRIEALPKELLLLIADFLPYRDLEAFNCTSKGLVTPEIKKLKDQRYALYLQREEFITSYIAPGRRDNAALVTQLSLIRPRDAATVMGLLNEYNGYHNRDPEPKKTAVIRAVLSTSPEDLEALIGGIADGRYRAQIISAFGALSAAAREAFCPVAQMLLGCIADRWHRADIISAFGKLRDDARAEFMLSRKVLIGGIADGVHRAHIIHAFVGLSDDAREAFCPVAQMLLDGIKDGEHRAQIISAFGELRDDAREDFIASRADLIGGIRSELQPYIISAFGRLSDEARAEFMLSRKVLIGGIADGRYRAQIISAFGELSVEARIAFCPVAQILIGGIEDGQDRAEIIRVFGGLSVEARAVFVANLGNLIGGIGLPLLLQGDMSIMPEPEPKIGKLELAINAFRASFEALEDGGGSGGADEIHIAPLERAFKTLEVIGMKATKAAIKSLFNVEFIYDIIQTGIRNHQETAVKIRNFWSENNRFLNQGEFQDRVLLLCSRFPENDLPTEDLTALFESLLGQGGIGEHK